MANWIEQLKQRLSEEKGLKIGNTLFKQYAEGFSNYYRDQYSPSVAASDIIAAESLSKTHPIEIQFQAIKKNSIPYLHLRLFKLENQISLADIVPLFENFGLRLESDNTDEIKKNNETIYLNNFVLISQSPFSLSKIKPLFQEAFAQTYFNLAENDGFNKLIINAGFNIREVTLIRAYAKYLKQIRFRFSQHFIEKTLNKHTNLAQQLLSLFELKHRNNQNKKMAASINKIIADILAALDKVTSLDEDHIIRTYLKLIQATVRTNYYQLTKANQPKEYIALKFNSSLVPELPLPVPLFEIFVYSYQFEAIHLRSEKVARGGIRWSDRTEDFRTEVLGLMKAQKVKNAVIVPSGAKGGFVLKNHNGKDKTREELEKRVIHSYQSFIRGLLDLTDNIVGQKIVAPKEVVCHDDADPYLVVAADKGTATFSDIANLISAEYQFWLGDAFASGGSMGYDHKKMGITACGAFESIKRHFRDLNIDIAKTPFSVIGIGDMSGDVFGNGLLYSNNIKLLAAFDHRHIFVDPNPDQEISYRERMRLFKLPTSSWEDYSAALISKGGGVFKRSLKTISITPQMSNALDIQETSLTPNELIRAILKAPVDLIYNGGIGTYVKASTETHADVGDRNNDLTRINGEEIRAKIVGEGGNLGFTQLGRIECAMKGVLINTDFIDNSAGVDCSDHEVNIKILLDEEIRHKRLTENKRNTILASLTQEIADLVLKDNKDQALVMSFTRFNAVHNLSLHTEYLKELESLGIINRKVEYLPDTKKLIDRKASGDGLTGPEIAVLLAYSKIHLKQLILNSTLPEDDFLQSIQDTAFPPTICKKFKEAISKHRLQRELFATQMSNHIVNHMGITFIYRLQVETGESIENIIKAFIMASQVFSSKELMHTIIALDFKIDVASEYDMLFHIRNLINLATRWFMKNHYVFTDIKKCIDQFKADVQVLSKSVPILMGGATREYLNKIIAQFREMGLPKELAEKIGTYRAIYTTLNIIDLARKHRVDLINTGKIYFKAGETMNLIWFRDQIAQDKREGHWHALARLTLRDDLDVAQRKLTVAILKAGYKHKDIEKNIQQWIDDNQQKLARWENVLSSIHSSTSQDFTMYFIAVRELVDLLDAIMQTYSNTRSVIAHHR